MAMMRILTISVTVIGAVVLLLTAWALPHQETTTAPVRQQSIFSQPAPPAVVALTGTMPTTRPPPQRAAMRLPQQTCSATLDAASVAAASAANADGIVFATFANAGEIGFGSPELN